MERTGAVGELRSSTECACYDEAQDKPENRCDKSNVYYESDQLDGDKRHCRHNQGDDEFQSAHETFLPRRALFNTLPKLATTHPVTAKGGPSVPVSNIFPSPPHR
jgi:hypothetical protein